MHKKSFIHPSIELRTSPTHGTGMFAKDNIPKGTIVIIWGGTFLKKKELPKQTDKFIIIQVDTDLWSVEPRDKPEDDTYYINHSCEPNVWMQDGITFVTIRDIKKDQELTTDYALFMPEDYVSKWTCRCLSKTCRKKNHWQRLSDF